MERVRLACVRHAASVRPEPGSNSPSRLTTFRTPRGNPSGQESESHHGLTRTIDNHRPFHPEGVEACALLIDVQPIRLSPDELPALAFGSHYSVFKERPGTHLSCRCWCRVYRRTVSGRTTPPASLLRLSEGPWEGRSDGCVTLADARQTVNASVRTGSSRGTSPRTGRCADRSGTSTPRRGCPPERPGSLQGGQCRHRVVACGEPPGPPHATRCSKLNWLSAPARSPPGHLGSVHRLLISSIYLMPRVSRNLMTA